jgi:hypothetical protein
MVGSETNHLPGPVEKNDGIRRLFAGLLSTVSCYNIEDLLK